jgi:putative tryptophan/tyrosine transport system substrate-binding protein
LVVLAITAVCSVDVAAQQPKVFKVGLLFGATPGANQVRVEAFRHGLRERGWVEGKEIIIEERYAEGNLDRLLTLVAELVGMKVDVIVAGSSAGIRLARESTATIPIVMTQEPDPVGNKFVGSLARPGGNVTGLSTLSPELSGKRLELLRQFLQPLKQVAIVGSSTGGRANMQALEEIEQAAAAFKVPVRYVDILDLKDVEAAFVTASRGGANAVLLLPTPIFNTQRKKIVELALKKRLATSCVGIEWVEDGGLMSYGVNFSVLYRRAATYVDKILKGTQPADILSSSR